MDVFKDFGYGWDLIIVFMNFWLCLSIIGYGSWLSILDNVLVLFRVVSSFRCLLFWNDL